QEHEARLRPAQPGEKSGKGGLAAPRGSFQQEPVPGVDTQTTAVQDRLATVTVAKHEIMRLEHRRRVPGTHSDASGRSYQGRGPPGPAGYGGRPCAPPDHA